MKIGFITCADLSRYFISSKNALFTHDDQVAVDFLSAHGHEVSPVIWGAPLKEMAGHYDVLIVRSPWDYMDSEEKRSGFFSWLRLLDQSGVRIFNDFNVLEWNLDKHYLRELERAGTPIVPTRFLEALEPDTALAEELARYGTIVVKPCIAAAAKDAYLIDSPEQLEQFRQHFASIRSNRAFMIQPFVKEICEQGEWSLVFLGGEYSHAVHKLPKKGHWLVQDELGGSVRSDEPPREIKAFASDAYLCLSQVLTNRFGKKGKLLYARVDVIGMGSSHGLRLSELELVEPELFFLDRRENTANQEALKLFRGGLEQI